MAISDVMANKKWGVFNHYLYNIQNNPAYPNNQGAGETSWQECTAALDVKKIARQLHEIGAGYYFITSMQGRRYMIAENARYREIVGDDVADECLSKRDLIEELYEALSEYGIDLYIYFTGDGPYKDEEEGKKFGFIEPRANISMEFCEKWASVLGWYAKKYAGKIKGYWIDGCYDEWFGYTTEKLEPYYNAVKSADPNALITMNNGVKVGLYRYFPKEDYVSGEQENLNVIPEGRYLDGAQTFILTPIGNGDMGIGCAWGSGGLSYTGDELADYAERVVAAGGVVTFDCMVARDGSFDEDQMRALKAVGDRVNNK